MAIVQLDVQRLKFAGFKRGLLFKHWLQLGQLRVNAPNGQPERGGKQEGQKHLIWRWFSQKTLL